MMSPLDAPWYYHLILLGIILVPMAIGALIAFIEIAIERSADRMMAKIKDRDPWDV